MEIKRIKIGITGGIGSGKSLFADFFIKKGYTVIDVDKLAKEIMKKNQNVKVKLIESFGSEVFTDNELNTKFLSNIVFNNNDKLQLLNQVVHPPLKKKVKTLLNKLDTVSHNSKQLIFADAALIYEAKMEKLFDIIVLITAEETIRINRIINRDNTSETEIKKRIEAQYSEVEKRKRSHFVFENNSTPEDLSQKAELLLKLI